MPDPLTATGTVVATLNGLRQLLAGRPQPVKPSVESDLTVPELSEQVGASLDALSAGMDTLAELVVSSLEGVAQCLDELDRRQRDLNARVEALEGTGHA